jgi:hypothetical protein
MYQVQAKSGDGPAGISVIVETAEAALAKIAEFKEAGYATVGVLDAVGSAIEEAALALLNGSKQAD